MPTKTTNYGLVKPTPEEYYDVEIQNTNMEIVDGALKKLEDNKEAGIKNAAEKTVLVDADTLPLSDSAESSKTKKVSFANVKSALKAYFDTMYNKTIMANNLTTTEEGSALDAVLGKKLADDISELNTFLSTVSTNSKYKSNLDANGIYTTVSIKRADGTLYMTSVLSGGTSPNYTTRVETYYASDGVTVTKTISYTRGYDGEGNLLSEVIV